MIKWFKKNQPPAEENLKTNGEEEVNPPSVPLSEKEEISKRGFFTSLKKGLSKTRDQFGNSIARVLLGKKQIDQGIIEELETILLTADLGMETTAKVLDKVSQSLMRKQLADGEAVLQELKEQLQEVLAPKEDHLNPETTDKTPFVILMVGVNGAGKTTTIGKLAKKYKQQGKKVMLAAGDTFRAAAVEQLKVWGERNDIPVIAQHTGADSASVLFDAVQAAKARHFDVVIADTAGRLHTQNNLMDELKKVKRVIQKIDPAAPHETMLVLDAGIGQNALNQARYFHEAVGVTGITMTKLDGTAKGGILFAIANELAIPFRYLGVGEGIEDLKPFDAAQFINAIFHDDSI